MGTTIKHMFQGVKPFDWLMLVIGTLVLFLILYEVIVGWVHRHKERKRQSAISHIIASIFEFMERGRKLQASVPDPSFDTPDVVDRWIESVKLWSIDTNNILAQHSLHASAAFVLVVNARSVDSTICSPEGQYFTVLGINENAIRDYSHNSTICEE